MERLTEIRGDRTWKLFHVSWYVNLVLVILVLLFSLYYLGEAWAGNPNDADRNTTMMATMLIIATVLLMGAGISRYSARLEGQHLELKLAIKEVERQVEELKNRGI